LVVPQATLTLHQGDDMGRPSLLTVRVPARPDSGIEVSGTAVPL
jgi:predicted PhzF superfamily epimerase YddE/YHI9